MLEFRLSLNLQLAVLAESIASGDWIFVFSKTSFAISLDLYSDAVVDDFHLVGA
jgi:hypothetical protein